MKELDLFTDIQENENLPLEGIKVVVTGSFGDIDSRKLSSVLQKQGAEVCPSPTKNVRCLFMGSNPSTLVSDGYEKLLHNGFSIPLAGQEEALRVMQGDTEWLLSLPEVKKDLDFTIGHYESHHPEMPEGRNIIASKEIFFGGGFAGDSLLFGQICGNLGAFGDEHCIYPETNICLLSDRTVELLRSGEKDDTVRYIEDFYNKSDAIVFAYSFLSEGDVLRWAEKRCRDCGDDLTMDMITRYKESCKRD